MEEFECVTIFFGEILGFEDIVRDCTPTEVMIKFSMEKILRMKIYQRSLFLILILTIFMKFHYQIIFAIH